MDGHGPIRGVGRRDRRGEVVEGGEVVLGQDDLARTRRQAVAAEETNVEGEGAVRPGGSRSQAAASSSLSAVASVTPVMPSRR